MQSTIKGGDLLGHKLFKNILSIGYEFETDQITKLSLHDNGHFLVNSDVTLHILKQKLNEHQGEQFDAKSYMLYIGIADIENPYEVEYSRFLQSHEDPPSDDELDESDLMDKGDTEDGMDAGETDYNTEYLEYMNDPRPEDDENTLFQLTNDIGDTSIGDVLNEVCEKRGHKKNNLYRLRVQGEENTYDIRFNEGMLDKSCGTMSNLEFVVTYLKPRQRNNDIIMETFNDACMRMAEHFDGLTKHNVDLYIRNNKTWSKVEPAVKHQFLYHKPGTNLFYLRLFTEDDDVDEYPTINHCTFVPQMTFRFNAWHGIAILKQMTEFAKTTYSSPEIGKRVDLFNVNLLGQLSAVESITNTLFANFNRGAKGPKGRLNLRKKVVKSLHFYIFMIYYKLMAYICNYAQEDTSGGYFKDYLSYMSRHSNYVYYCRCKEILAAECPSAKLIDLIYQPAALAQFFCRTDCFAELKPRSRHFGDPSKSVLSYFQHMERRLPRKSMDATDIERYRDWLKRRNIDSFSSQFPLLDDTVIIENRGFYNQMLLMAKQFVDKRTKAFSVNTLKKLVEHGRKNRWAIDTTGRTLNTKTNRWVKSAAAPGVRRTKKNR
jgi:hypothetical protein